MKGGYSTAGPSSIPHFELNICTTNLSMHSIATLAVLCVSLGGSFLPFTSTALGLTSTNIARLAAAASVTLDYYSLLTTTNTERPAPTFVISDSIAGIASVSVQPDGETVYAETIVVTLNALVNGTSTITNLLSEPTTSVCKRATMLIVQTTHSLIQSRLRKTPHGTASPRRTS